MRLFITSAFAQGIGGSAATNDIIMQVLPLVAVAFIFYFLLLRPQQKRAKAQQEMVASVRKGDTVVTSGGFIVKVIRSVEGESDIQVELAENVRVRLLRSMIVEVRSKTEPVKGDTPS